MKRLAWFALALVASCRADQLAYEEVPVTVSANEVWGGTPLVFTSAAFTGVDSVPLLVTAGPETLQVSSAGVNAFAVIMPQNDGFYTLDVTLHEGERMTPVDIRVHGFLSGSQGPRVSGRVQPVAGFSNPTGIVFMDRRLAVFNLKTGTAVPLGSPSDTGFGSGCSTGVIPAATNPLVVTVSRPGTPSVPCQVYAVTIGSALTFLDSSQVSTGFADASIYLGSGRWVIGRKNASIVITGPGVSYDDGCTGARGMVAAPPPAYLVVPIACFRQGGVPVWDPRTGLHAYVLDHVGSVDAAAFSEAGDTLFIGARGSGSSPDVWLFVVDAATGAIRDSVSLPFFADQGAYSDIAVDPNGRWLYVAHSSFGGSITVSVFDRATLGAVATLRTGNFSAYPFWLWRLVVGADRVLYLATTELSPDNGSMVYRWSLMP